jgi:hypothetical protein
MFRKMVLRDFRRNKKLYRMRDVGEATFGGLKAETHRAVKPLRQPPTVRMA